MPAVAEFLRLSEVAAILGVNHCTLLSWIEEGRLPAYKPGRRVRLVRRSELDAFIENSKVCA